MMPPFPTFAYVRLLVAVTACAGVVLESGVLQAQPLAATVDSTESVIDYTGSAAMHDWTGTSRKVSGTLVLDPAIPESSRAVIRTPVASFESGPDRRDRKMREVTEADEYPVVEYRTREVRPTHWGRSSDGHAGQWAVTGDLTFHGQTHPVDATVTVRVTEDSVRARAQFPVSLTRFDVERPKLLWTAPIADTIRIDARIVGAIEKPSTATPPLDTTRSEATGTRRITSRTLREITPLQYSGANARLHAAVRTPPDEPREWALSIYGFADAPTGLADSPSVSLQANRQPVTPHRTTGATRNLDDGTTLEIVRMYFPRSTFETLASALTVSATLGSARFAIGWSARRALRLMLEDRSPSTAGRVSSNDRR